MLLIGRNASLEKSLCISHLWGIAVGLRESARVFDRWNRSIIFPCRRLAGYGSMAANLYLMQSLTIFRVDCRYRQVFGSGG